MAEEITREMLTTAFATADGLRAVLDKLLASLPKPVTFEDVERAVRERTPVELLDRDGKWKRGRVSQVLRHGQRWTCTVYGPGIAWGGSVDLWFENTAGGNLRFVDPAILAAEKKSEEAELGRCRLAAENDRLRGQLADERAARAVAAKASKDVLLRALGDWPADRDDQLVAEEMIRRLRLYLRLHTWKREIAAALGLVDLTGPNDGEDEILAKVKELMQVNNTLDRVIDAVTPKASAQKETRSA